MPQGITTEAQCASPLRSGFDLTQESSSVELSEKENVTHCRKSQNHFSERRFFSGNDRLPCQTGALSTIRS